MNIFYIIITILLHKRALVLDIYPLPFSLSLFIIIIIIIFCYYLVIFVYILVDMFLYIYHAGANILDTQRVEVPEQLRDLRRDPRVLTLHSLRRNIYLCHPCKTTKNKIKELKIEQADSKQNKNKIE